MTDANVLFLEFYLDIIQVVNKNTYIGYILSPPC